MDWSWVPTTHVALLTATYNFISKYPVPLDSSDICADMHIPTQICTQNYKKCEN